MNDLEKLSQSKAELEDEDYKSSCIRHDLINKIKKLKLSLVKDNLKNTEWKICKNKDDSYRLYCNDLNVIKTLSDILDPYNGECILISKDENDNVFEIRWWYEWLINADQENKSSVLYCNNLHYLKFVAKQFNLIIDYSPLKEYCLSELESLNLKIEDLKKILKTIN